MHKLRVTFVVETDADIPQLRGKAADLLGKEVEGEKPVDRALDALYTLVLFCRPTFWAQARKEPRSKLTIERVEVEEAPIG
jgi:hypothetical protein